MFFGNIALTIFSLKLGFNYYGLGYCVSMILAFLVGSILFVRFLNRLNYHIFITNIVKKEKIASSKASLPPEFYQEKDLHQQSPLEPK
jgi:uncharacterized membrane protein